MKFTSSTLFAVFTVLPVIAAQKLNKTLHVIIATDWDKGTVKIDGGPFIVIPDDAPIMIDIHVKGHTKGYRQVHGFIVDEVNKDHEYKFSTTRLIDQQATTIKSKFALTSDPGVEYVHIILDDKYAVNINVFGDALISIPTTISEVRMESQSS